MFPKTARSVKTASARLRRVIDPLGPEHALMAARLDRLARSTCDLRKTLIAITERKVGLRSLAGIWADAATADGHQRAVADCAKLPARPKLSPHQVKEPIKRRDAGEPVRQIARGCVINQSTISGLTI